MPNIKMPTVVKMKAHLKSKNSSWCFKKKTKNLYFDNPLGFVFQNKKGTTLVFRGKKTFFKNILAILGDRLVFFLGAVS